MVNEIIETLTKIDEFIEANKNTNYKIRMLDREVPNIGELVEKLNLLAVVWRSEQLVCHHCGSILVKTTNGYQCPNAKCSI